MLGGGWAMASVSGAAPVCRALCQSLGGGERDPETHPRSNETADRAPSLPRPAAGCGLEAVGDSWEVWGGVAGRAAGTPLLLHRPVSSGPGTAANPCCSAQR